MGLGFILSYAWIGYQLLAVSRHAGLVVCPLKIVAGIPCPSCGSTRSLMEIFHGDFLSAAMINPLGFIIFLILSIGPIWLITDLISGSESLWITFNKLEKQLKRPGLAIPLVLLVLMNWAWNIIKEL